MFIYQLLPSTSLQSIIKNQSFLKSQHSHNLCTHFEPCLSSQRTVKAEGFGLVEQREVSVKCIVSLYVPYQYIRIYLYLYSKSTNAKI